MDVDPILWRLWLWTKKVALATSLPDRQLQVIAYNLVAWNQHNVTVLGMNTYLRHNISATWHFQTIWDSTSTVCSTILLLYHVNTIHSCNVNILKQAQCYCIFILTNFCSLLSCRCKQKFSNSNKYTIHVKIYTLQ